MNRKERIQNLFLGFEEVLDSIKDYITNNHELLGIPNIFEGFNIVNIETYERGYELRWEDEKPRILTIPLHSLYNMESEESRKLEKQKKYLQNKVKVLYREKSKIRATKKALETTVKELGGFYEVDKLIKKKQKDIITVSEVLTKTEKEVGKINKKLEALIKCLY